MQVKKRYLLSVLALISLVASFGGSHAIQVRDEDSVKFIQDLPDTSTQTFIAAAATMDGCSEPIVNGEAKTQWPELIGKTADEAKVILQQEAPGFHIQVLGADMMATMDWNCRRIRVWLDDTGKVARKPIIG
jgi:hypothetical protein